MQKGTQLSQERRGVVGSGPGSTIKYLRHTMSGAADNGLGATIKVL
jgi:hypothetical protein